MRSEKNNKLQLSDEEIIQGVINRDTNALEKLYKNYYPMILKLVVNNSGNEDDAKDIYQEAIVAVYKKIESQGLELSSSLKTYIYSICRRLWLKKLNQKDKFKTSSIHDYEDVLPIDESDFEQHHEREKAFQTMQKALNLLGEPCRSLIEGFYLKGQSMQDISEEFGYTNADNAKNQKYKCLQRLKKLFFSNSDN